MSPAEFSSLATGLSALIAAMAFLFGLGAWKREFVGKRRIELAEDALALGYEVSEIVGWIRFPMASSTEASQRKRGADEDPEETEALDRAYTVFARIQSNEAVLSRFMALRYRFKAAFGPESDRPFETVKFTLAKIQVSARSLGDYYWRRERGRPHGEESEQHREARAQHESVFWDSFEPEDPIRVAIAGAIKELEQRCEQANKRGR